MNRRILYSPIVPIFAALILRAIHLLSITDSPVMKILVIDSAYYYHTAVKISDGMGAGPGVFFMSPLYPYFLSVWFSLFGDSVMLIAALQIALSCFTISLIWSTTLMISNEKAALTAALIAAVYPVWIYYDGMVLTTSLIMFLNTLGIWLIFKQIVLKDRLASSLNHSLLVLVGIILGLSALARPGILLFGFLLGIWQVKKKNYIFPVLIFAGIMISVLPVTIRNYYKSGEFAATTASGGMNFYVGNSPFSTGLYVEPDFLRSSEPEYELRDYKSQAERLSGKELSYTENSRFWYKSGWKFLISNPGRAVNLWWNKFFYFWNNLEAPDNLSYYLVKRYSPILKFLPFGFGLLAAAGLAGLMLIKSSEYKHIIRIYLYSLILVCVIFFSSSEFRFPVVAVLCIGTGIFVSGIIDDRGRFLKNWKTISFVILFLIFSHFHTQTGQFLKSPRMDYFNLASVSLKNNDFNSAVEYFQESLREDPGFKQGHMGLGTALMEIGRFEEAAKEFRNLGYNIDADTLKAEYYRMKKGG